MAGFGLLRGAHNGILSNRIERFQTTAASADSYYKLVTHRLNRLTATQYVAMLRRRYGDREWRQGRPSVKQLKMIREVGMTKQLTGEHMRRVLIATGLFLGQIVFPTVWADESYGSWGVGVGDDRSFLYAATVNDSADLLGQYCTPSEVSCMWLLGLSTKCETGHEYPLLANSDTGALQLEIVCSGPLPNGNYKYAFKNFDQIDELVKRAQRVGFAMPMQGDQFRVVRFMLNGATAAVTSMRTSAEKMAVKKSRTHSDTRDQDI